MMDIKKYGIRAEIKELRRLMRMDEKYKAVILDGILPNDQQSNEYHHQRVTRIDELSRKYGLLL